jgi:hypothetical protein
MNDMLRWRTASYTSGQGNCVETAELPDGGGMAVRDTKDRDGGALQFSANAWREFTDAVKAGRIS